MRNPKDNGLENDTQERANFSLRAGRGWREDITMSPAAKKKRKEKIKTDSAVIDEVLCGFFMSAGEPATICVWMMPLVKFSFVEN